jgi:sulfide:quinone oxidoreductase
MTDSDRFRVLIAGAGVAALEGALALRAMLREHIEITFLAPEREFVYRALAVAEPFGRGETQHLAVAEIAKDLEAEHCRDSLAGVEPRHRTVRTAGGRELGYEALLIAIGARPVTALRGALTYRGLADNPAYGLLLRELERGEVEQLAFAVPPTVHWSLPLYELALLTSAHLEAREIGEVRLSLITHEAEPLSQFGQRASQSVRELLADAGVKLVTSAAPVGVEPGRVLLASGDSLAADRVVALPRLEVTPIPGLPQGPRGFIGTDSYMRVEGLPRVYAAGDATWFPIKQGGVAAQQADTAAATIASCIDREIRPTPFRPVLRGALLTGEVPHYLRSEIGDRDASSAAGPAALWWPPSKVAGRHLAPYLGRRIERNQPEPPLGDLEPLHGEDRAKTAAEHHEAVALALTAADGDARWHDYRGALRWLEVAEQLDLTLPPEYVKKRGHWNDALAASETAVERR